MLAAASPRGCPYADVTTWLAPGWAARYCCAAPVADETVALTPSGLQSGAAAADGAPTIPIAIPPSRQPALMPAILLNFMLIVPPNKRTVLGGSRSPEIHGSREENGRLMLFAHNEHPWRKRTGKYVTQATQVTYLAKQTTLCGHRMMRILRENEILLRDRDLDS